MLESARSQSLKTKLWFILMQVFKLRKPKTAEYQDYLPKQPVPKLKDTVEKYVTSYEGLLSKDELASLRQDSKKFLSRAKNLQSKIEQKSLIEVKLSSVTISFTTFSETLQRFFMAQRSLSDVPRLAYEGQVMIN